MAPSIQIHFRGDYSVSKQDIRDAIAGLTEDGLSKKSPVTPGGGELVPVVNSEHEDTPHFKVVCDGHGGGWSKTSQEAIKNAVLDVEGVNECTGIDGGYES